MNGYEDDAKAHAKSAMEMPIGEPQVEAACDGTVTVLSWHRDDGQPIVQRDRLLKLLGDKKLKMKCDPALHVEAGSKAFGIAAIFDGPPDVKFKRNLRSIWKDVVAFDEQTRPTRI